MSANVTRENVPPHVCERVLRRACMCEGKVENTEMVVIHNDDNDLKYTITTAACNLHRQRWRQQIRRRGILFIGRPLPCTLLRDCSRGVVPSG